MSESITTPDSFQIEHLGPLGDLDRYAFGPLVGKVFLRDRLRLTGCELSLHRLKADQGMPFLHAHRQNEELYLVLEGDGLFHLDGQELSITQGDAIRVSPTVSRGYRAGPDGLFLLCVQAKESSLEQATRTDGYRLETKASWMG